MTEMTINLKIGAVNVTMAFDPDIPVHHSMLVQLQNTGAYEPGTQMFLARALRSGDTFVDIGAHIGYFSTMAAAFVGESGAVLAVEPTDENYAWLERNASFVTSPRIQTIKSVISNIDGEVTFHLNKDNDGGHALWEPRLHPHNVKTKAAPESVTAPSKTLATLLDQFGCSHIRLMKIDTEGAEPMILRSGADFLCAGAVDFIIAEVNYSGLVFMGDSIDSFFDLAREFGFIVCLLDDAGGPAKVMDSRSRPDPKYVYNVLLARPDAFATL